MIPEGRFETSRISPGNTSKLLKIHISNFHRISISLAEVRLASGPCLERRLLFPSPPITLLSLSLSLFIFFLSRFFTCDRCIFSASRTAIPDWVTAIRMAFSWSSPSFLVTGYSYVHPCFSCGVASLAPLVAPGTPPWVLLGSPWVPLLTGQPPMRNSWLL